MDTGQPPATGPTPRRRDALVQQLRKHTPKLHAAALTARYLAAMNFDATDPNWWSALSAGLALLVALVSLGAAIVSNRTAARSAAADELASKLAKGLARTCHARWEVKNKGSTWKNIETNPEPTEEGTVRVTNTGEEVALNVTLEGESIRKHEPAAKIQPGEWHDFPYFYDVALPDEAKEVVIEWDRPEEFGDERMRVQRKF